MRLPISLVVVQFILDVGFVFCIYGWSIEKYELPPISGFVNVLGKAINQLFNILFCKEPQGETINFTEHDMQQYFDYASLLRQAVNNCSVKLDLKHVNNLSEITCKNKFGKSKSGVIYFRYRVRQTAANVAADDMKRILQTELDNIYSIWNYSEVSISVLYHADMVVEILMASKNDIRRAIKI